MKRPNLNDNHITFTEERSPCFNAYTKEIKKIPILSEEQELYLVEKMQSGTPEEKSKAKETLIKANLKFVISVAKKHQNQGLFLEDLIAEGNNGLIRAIEKYKPNKGTKLISYAVWHIKARILAALKEESEIIRIPQNKATSKIKNDYENSKINEKKESLDKYSLWEIEEALLLENSKERIPLDVSIKQTKFPADNFYSLQEYTPSIEAEEKDISFEKDPSLEKVTLAETIPNYDNFFSVENIFDEEDLKKEIPDVLDTLSLREKEIVELYFGLNGKKEKTMEEIGEKFNLDRERVRQIKEKAIRRLRHGSRSKRLRPYLG